MATTVTTTTVTTTAAEMVARVSERLGGNEGAARLLVANSRLTRALIRGGAEDERKRLEWALKKERRAVTAVEGVLAAKQDVPGWRERAAETRFWEELLAAAREAVRKDEAELARLEKEISACLSTV